METSWPGGLRETTEETLVRKFLRDENQNTILGEVHLRSS